MTSSYLIPLGTRSTKRSAFIITSLFLILSQYWQNAVFRKMSNKTSSADSFKAQEVTLNKGRWDLNKELSQRTSQPRLELLQQLGGPVLCFHNRVGFSGSPPLLTIPRSGYAQSQPAIACAKPRSFKNLSSHEPRTRVKQLRNYSICVSFWVPTKNTNTKQQQQY